MTPGAKGDPNFTALALSYRSSPDFFLVGWSLCRITKDLTTLCFVLFDEAAAVRNLTLFRDVCVVYGASKGVLVDLNHSANSNDVQLFGFSAGSKIFGDDETLARNL